VWHAWPMSGVGQLEPTNPAAPPIPRNRTSNRAQRPIAHWTPNDVAVEFISRLGIMHPQMNWVPITKAGILVASQRKRIGTTPVEEIEMAELWLARPGNYSDTLRDPVRLFFRWVGAWPRLLGEVREAQVAQDTPRESYSRLKRQKAPLSMVTPEDVSECQPELFRGSTGPSGPF
jgi:hypothetical protein